jgi:hypothetical protein
VTGRAAAEKGRHREEDGGAEHTDTLGDGRAMIG